MVEAEMAVKRATRAAPSSRTAFRIWSLVILVALFIGALCFLEFLVSEIPRRAHKAAGQEATQP